MNKINSSLRTKKRYLFIQGKKEDVEKAILDYLGILGWGKASPVFVESKNLILAINREEIENVKAALELADLKVLRVSGTLKGLKK